MDFQIRFHSVRTDFLSALKKDAGEGKTECSNPNYRIEQLFSKLEYSCFWRLNYLSPSDAVIYIHATVVLVSKYVIWPEYS